MMIRKILAKLRGPARELDWRRVSSAEQRAGKFTIVDDPSDPDVQVLVDGQAVFPGFGCIKEAKDWCERQHVSARDNEPATRQIQRASFRPADGSDMTASARDMIPDLDENGDPK